MTTLRARLRMSTGIIILVIAGLLSVAFTERARLNAQLTRLAAEHTAVARAYAMNQAVLHDAALLGHAEPADTAAAPTFPTALEAFQRLLDSGIFDADEQDDMDQISVQYAAYARAATTVRTAATAQRAAPSAAGQARLDAAWTALAPLRDRLAGATQDLAAHAEADVAASQDAIQALNRRRLSLLLLIGGIIILVVLGTQAVASRALGRPMHALLAAVQRFAAGAQDTRVVVTRRDEVGVLASAFNELAQTIQDQTQAVETQYAAAVQAQAVAEHAQAQIADQLATIAQQDALLRDLSVPILPISRSTLVLPLIGTLDTDRLRRMQEQALRHLNGRSIRSLILDITGVPVVDTLVAQGLLEVIQAARLLGTETMIVGVRPEVAQTIVGLGLDLRTVVTHASLDAGIAAALRRAPAA